MILSSVTKRFKSKLRLSSVQSTRKEESMTAAEIKRKRTESLLKELIPEALATLDDALINTLTVTEVLCSRGRNDAKVFLDKSYLDETEQKEALKRLRRVASYLQSHICQTQGWYRAPKLSFVFDEHYEHIDKMQQLFEQIASNKGS